MAFVDIGLPVILQETEIADALDLGMVAEEGAYLGRILARAGHTEFQCLEAAQQHPRAVRVGDRADRVPHGADLVEQRLGADDAAGDAVAVAACLFGEPIGRASWRDSVCQYV